MENESVERFFLRYAFPCTYVLKQRGDVDEATFDEIEDAAINGAAVSRELLEQTYPNALRRMKIVAGELGRPLWSKDVVSTYFRQRHNDFIEEGDGGYKDAPQALKDFCRVEKAVVAEAREGFLVVRYGGENRIRTVSSAFVPAAKKGDRVSIHHGYAAEVL